MDEEQAAAVQTLEYFREWIGRHGVTEPLVRAPLNQDSDYCERLGRVLTQMLDDAVTFIQAGKNPT